MARLDRVVGDVLDFARPLRIEPASVDASALARDAAQAALEGAPRRSTRASASSRGRASVVTDGERLRAALVNLVANARDSLGGAARALTGRAGAGDGRDRQPCGSTPAGSWLWVEDAGDGIAEADLPHVFEPYFTTKRTGTGLGLAITRKTIEALGGTIRLESRAGRGDAGRDRAARATRRPRATESR